MKPKISIRKWNVMIMGRAPILPFSFEAPFPARGYQVLFNGTAIARTTDQKEARRVAYHLRKKI